MCGKIIFSQSLVDRLRMPENKLEYKRKCVETRMFILSWALVLERRTFCASILQEKKKENLRGEKIKS